MERNRKWRHEAGRCDLYAASVGLGGGGVAVVEERKEQVYLPVHTSGLQSLLL